MLQFNNTALQEPYVNSSSIQSNSISNKQNNKEPSSKIILEHCNMETSKNIPLNGTLFITEKNKGKALPVIVIRTPYGRGGNSASLARIFAVHDYCVLIQDTRGRFGSGGQFFPVAHEIEDGIEVLKWIKKQSFCNGKIGGFGISYLGLTSYAAANSEHMDAIVPVLASARLFPIFKAPNGGGLSLDLGLRWLYIVLNLQLQLDGSYRSLFHFVKSLLFSAPELEKALMHLPLKEADSIVTLNKAPVEFFQKAICNLNGDEEFWSDKDHLYDFSDNNGNARNAICPPVHMIGGWYDFFLYQQLEDYKKAIIKQENTRLTIGNFAHWDIRNYFPIATKVAIDWFDEFLKNEKSKNRTKNPVNIFVMGAGRNLEGKWASIPTFPPQIKSQKIYYLGRGNRLEDSVLDDMAGEETYTYDPRSNPTPAIGGTSFDPANCGIRVQDRFEQRDDVIIFTSDKLTEPVEVCGYIKMILYVKTNRRHTDFVGRLCCVYPNGTSINICDGMMRVSPEIISENDSDCMSLGVENDGQNILLRLRIEIGVTAFTFQPGQALRLQICSGAHSRWLRNYGTGEKIDNATILETAKQTILFGDEYVSRLELPETNLFDDGNNTDDSRL